MTGDLFLVWLAELLTGKAGNANGLQLARPWRLASSRWLALASRLRGPIPPRGQRKELDSYYADKIRGRTQLPAPAGCQADKYAPAVSLFAFAAVHTAPEQVISKRPCKSKQAPTPI